MFYKGSLSEFEAWLLAANEAEGLPNADTENYSEATKNSTSDEYAWPYGDYPIEGRISYTYEELRADGFWQDDILP